MGSGSAAVDDVTSLRRSLICLAAIGIGGSTIELGTLRHWDTPTQTIPWFALGVATISLGLLLVVRPSPRTVTVVRALAVAVLLTAVYGLWEHARANHAAGPLDRRYSLTWFSMSEMSRWWKAVSGGVGPSPTLAPAALAHVALCQLFATTGLTRDPRPTVAEVPAEAGRRATGLRPRSGQESVDVSVTAP